jgi:hypothetical protein
MAMVRISGVIDQKLCAKADASHPIPAKYRGSSTFNDRPLSNSERINDLLNPAMNEPAK